jgi:glycogen operon protein
VLALRARRMRSFLATLLLSQGVPMILGGDEIGRTQQGNNNAYCQDNEISWYDWSGADAALLEFVQRLIQFRVRHPVFCRRRWFQGRAIHGSDVGDIGWFTSGGTEMSDDDWQAGFAKSLGVFLNGDAIPTRNEHGERVEDDSFYVMFNAHHEALEFTLPEAKWGERWTDVLNTGDAVDGLDDDEEGAAHEAGGVVKVAAWSMVLLRRAASATSPAPAP